MTRRTDPEWVYVRPTVSDMPHAPWRYLVCYVTGAAPRHQVINWPQQVVTADDVASVIKHLDAPGDGCSPWLLTLLAAPKGTPGMWVAAADNPRLPYRYLIGATYSGTFAPLVWDFDELISSGTHIDVLCRMIGEEKQCTGVALMSLQLMTAPPGR